MLGEAVILSLAAWRIAHFLVMENGPFGVALKLRERLGIEADPETGRAVSWPGGGASGNLAEAFTCVGCLSFWVATLIVSIHILWGEHLWGAIVVLAVAAGAKLVQDIVYG